MSLSQAEIKALWDQRAEKLAAARAYHEEHSAEWGSTGTNGEDPGEHEAKFRAMLAEADTLKERAEREAKLRDEERREIADSLKRDDSRRADPNAEPSNGNGKGDGRNTRAASERRSIIEAERAERRRRGLPQRPIDRVIESRHDLTEAQESGVEAWFDLQAMEMAPTASARSARFESREELHKRALQADLDVSGGYLVPPTQWIARLIKAVDDMVFMQQRATVIPVTSSDSLGAPSLDADPADPAWTSEIGAISEDSTMAFGGRELVPHQLTKLVKVSEKLIMVSAIPVESLVRDRLAYKLATTFENAYLNGTGAGQPLGIFTASAQGISTGRDVTTDMSTTAVTIDGLKSVRGTLKSQYRNRAAWVLHRDLETQIAKLKTGDGYYLWQQGVQAGDPDRLLGFPVLLSEFAPNTFTTGQYVAVLGALDNYWIALMQGANLRRLDELYIANGQIGFRIKSWADGMPVLEEAFVRAKLA